MAPKAWRNVRLGFGLVSVEVGIAPAIPDRGRVKGKKLDEKTHTPVKQRWVTEDGEVSESQVTGYESNGKYVLLDGEPTVDGPSDVQLEFLVPEESIDRLYFESSYWIWPRKGGELGHDLLAAAIRETGRMAIGRVALTKTTRLVAIRWSNAAGCLVCHVLAFDEAVDYAAVRQIQEEKKTRPEPSKDQIEMAKQVIGSLPGNLDLSKFSDNYQAALREAIARGGKVAKPPTEKVAPVPDVIEALKASIEGTKKPRKSTKKATAKA